MSRLHQLEVCVFCIFSHAPHLVDLCYGISSFTSETGPQVVVALAGEVLERIACQVAQSDSYCNVKTSKPVPTKASR